MGINFLHGFNSFGCRQQKSSQGNVPSVRPQEGGSAEKWLLAIRAEFSCGAALGAALGAETTSCHPASPSKVTPAPGIPRTAVVGV